MVFFNYKMVRINLDEYYENQKDKIFVLFNNSITKKVIIKLNKITPCQ